MSLKKCSTFLGEVQFAKMYERKIYSSMAAALICFYRKYSDGEYIHKSELVKHQSLSGTFGGGDFAKLSLWNLISEKPSDKKAKGKTSGYWAITSDGKLFVQGLLKVKSYVRIYDGHPYGFTGDLVDIHNCLGTRFSYEKLMKGEGQ